MSPLCSKPSNSSCFTHSKIQSSHNAWQDLALFRTLCSLPSLSSSCHLLGRFLPPGICPCSSLCWEHVSSNTYMLTPSLHSGICLNRTSSERIPDHSSSILFCSAFITTQLYVTYLLSIFPLKCQFVENKDVVHFAYCCVPSS